MAKRSKKQKKRVRNLALVCTLTTIVLVASTFAWFIGMRTVNVNSFDVTIAAVDGLSLSLDGEHFTEILKVGKDETAYTGNTNSWADSGLIPVSTVGVLDETSSTLKMFEKASLTTTEGGYRLLASRVKNYEEKDGKYREARGYVAFDLFIKNLSGTEYYVENNEKNEEAIYLTNDSAVKVSTAGGVDGTGIENSVRVAFAQIGRVIATNKTTNIITGLDCKGKVDNENAINTTTGICRTATIWEPNDRNHVADAISNYNNACKSRTDATTYGAEGTCSPLVDGLAKQTYAISDEINYKNEEGDLPVVDVYDGADYNGYTGSTVLEAFKTFTDSDKLKTGTSRQQFFSLAPNSITKVRVYVFLEGQDVDNYDFAQIGKKISVNFGFTKQRFNEEDTNYQGSTTNEGDGPFVWDEETQAYKAANDKTKPFIKLTGEGLTNDTLTTAKGTTLDLDTKVTAKAYDKVTTFTKTNENGEDVYTVNTVTDTELVAVQETGVGVITKTGTVNTDVAGTYQVVYSVKDAAGNLGTKVLTVIVTE